MHQEQALSIETLGELQICHCCNEAKEATRRLRKTTLHLVHEDTTADPPPPFEEGPLSLSSWIRGHYAIVRQSNSPMSTRGQANWLPGRGQQAR